MQKNDTLNVNPIQMFIQQVKSADASKQREIKMPIENAKRLAFTLGETLAKLNGDLEKIIKEQQEQEDIVQVQLDGGNTW